MNRVTLTLLLVGILALVPSIVGAGGGGKPLNAPNPRTTAIIGYIDSFNGHKPNHNKQRR